MDVTEDTFERDVIERSREVPVIVDFWAAWCGPCLALDPVLKQEVERRDGAVVLAKVDVDAHPALAARYRVQGIPAVKGFRNGRVAAEFVGARAPAGVASFIDELLSPPRIETLVQELRENGELPEVLAALDEADRERALDLILAAIPGSSAERKDRLRELAVAIFDDLGHDDPLTVAYRRRLASVLY
jgi:putative thioredoxin